MTSIPVHDPEKGPPSPTLSVAEKEHSDSVHNETLASSKEGAATPIEQETTPAEQAAPPPALDWDDEHDPDNPHNWSASKRAYNTFVPGLLGLAITFGSSIYTPSYHEIAERYHISSVAALVPLSVWTFGLGFGPMLGAPLSEMHGRKIVYMISTPLSLLFTMGAGLSNSFSGIVICRFFGALFGSPILAVGAGTIADIYPPRDRAQGAASFVAAPFLGPALGPFVGGFAIMNKDYRWTNWAELMVLGAAGILSLFLSESYRKIILRRRAIRRGIEMPPAPRPPAKVLVQLLLLKPLSMLVFEPIVQSFSLYVAFAFAVLFAFFAAFPIVFTGVYRMNPGESGMAFFGVGIGVLLGVASAIVGDRLIYRKKLDAATANGTLPLPPEERLFPAMVGSLGLPIGLFWYVNAAALIRAWAEWLTDR